MKATYPLRFIMPVLFSMQLHASGICKMYGLFEGMHSKISQGEQRLLVSGK